MGKNYSCGECDKTFLLKQSLKEHVKAHSDDKPYQCGECNSAFKSSSALASHRLKHSDVKSHMCDVCKKRFADKKSVMRHFLAKHTNYRPFKFTACDLSFVVRHGLTDHLRKKHPGENMDVSETIFPNVK